MLFHCVEEVTNKEQLVLDIFAFGLVEMDKMRAIDSVKKAIQYVARK